MVVQTATSPEHRTVSRVMTILELVVSSGASGMRLGDLASSLDAPKSSLHALTKGLVSTGYLREAGGHYLAGPAIASLIAPKSVAAHYLYVPTLTSLAERWNETTMIANLVGDSLVYVESVESAAFIRAIPPLHKRYALWPRSSGRVFLAHMEPRRFENYLRRHHPEPTEAGQVRAEVDRTRQTGVGLNIGETIAEHVGIAVPVFTGEATVTTALAIAGPRGRMEESLDAIVADLRAAADTISV